MKINEYFELIEREVKKNYEIANDAKKIGIDPISGVEIPVATSLAQRIVGLVSVLYPQIQNEKIVDRVLELEKIHKPLNPIISLIIAEETAKENFCKFKSHLEAMEAGIRVGIGYLTLGYVSSPIEGFIQLKVKKTLNGGDYISPYYSGPIRSAGGSEAAFSLVIVDYLRQVFGYVKYDPTEEEVKRGIQECYEYHERVTNLQYLPSEQEIEFLMRNLPIQLTGDPSEDKEVYNYKDLPRIETNFIRSGFALVLGEGLAQKALKIFGRISALKKKGFSLKDWDWLEDFVKLQKKIKESKSSDGGRVGATYIQDLVAGRPVFAHPSRSGAFRLRYGRVRNSGYSTLALNPATMGITQGFIAIGTQLKIEKPTKGCTIASCDSIDGPIVKFFNGDVRKIESYEEAEKIYNQVSEIIYLGDILVPYGDFANRNHPLEKQGYIEEYWIEELRKKNGESELNIERSLNPQDLDNGLFAVDFSAATKPLGFVTFEKAVEISEKFEIPLHPKYIYYWSQIEYQEFLSLIDWLAHSRINEGILLFPYSHIDKERFKSGKRSLELTGCEHKVTIENVILDKENTKSFLFNLGIDFNSSDLEREVDDLIKKIFEEKVLEVVNGLCKVEIKDKAGTFIGARMGRPEKAKLRKLTGSPHVLFPVGEEGGRLRSFQSALENGSVRAEFSIYYCENCKNENVYPKCERCGIFCNKLSYCKECDKNYNGKCLEHNFVSDYKEKKIDINYYFTNARKLLGVNMSEISPVIKGVRGTINKDHSCEHIAKGILRAKYNLNVNKDGTIRYDMTEMPITHFKPKEVDVGVDKLKELGYKKDIYGKELENLEQILEIFPHDIILPACPLTPDEKADEVFLNVSKFLDEELEKIYKVKKIFNAVKREDLIGQLFACISPHTCVTTVCRLIGFSKIQVLLASPYIHGAMRRDCDGDEAAVMLLMDLLLNFSRKFIPSHRGGTQDAPLVLNMRIRANEVDDMVFDLDVSKKIPLELYLAGEKHLSPGEVKMDQIKSRIGGDKEFEEIFFSYDSLDINLGPLCSSYKTLPTMQDKVDKMMGLCKKIRAVDVDDVARLIIERHFIRDIKGNLRKFSQQGFRCSSCNSKYRRPPLIGKCTKCGGKLIFTISEGSILKYMLPALNLARSYNVSKYLLENLELTEMYIQSIFGKEKEKQENLGKWV